MTDTYVLGFNSGVIGHNASACLIKNGHIIASAEQERFTRMKQDGGFPYDAIIYCLDEAGINASRVDHWAYYWAPWLLIDRYKNIMPHYSFFDAFNYIYVMDLYWRKQMLAELSKLMLDCFAVSIESDKFHFVPHHLAHASSAYHLSGFTQSAILTIDGYGESESSLLAVGEGNNIRMLNKISIPSSLGCFYSIITMFLGFKLNSGEYKVMGLAPYGKPEYYEKLRGLVKFNDDGTYTIDARIYTQAQYQEFYNKGRYPSFLVSMLGQPRTPESPLEQRHKDIAKSIQLVCEDCMLHSAKYLLKYSKNLCLAGGVALNSVGNGRIKKELPFERVFVQPASNDAGGSIGSATYIYTKVTGQPCAPMTHVYLGKGYSDHDIEEQLISYELEYEKAEDIEAQTAKLISEGKIVGWFQGRMEFGPRALGNRSILADARYPYMRDKVNEAVKLREKFRPFAPSLLQEDQDRYLDMHGLPDSPYMLFVLPIKEEMRSKFPAITHIDGTARPQTVSASTNQRYYRLLDEYRKITGESLILNTSFNVRGEPIVMTPRDAIRCYLDTDIDVLVLHNFLITKKNLKHKEDYARSLSD